MNTKQLLPVILLFVFFISCNDQKNKNLVADYKTAEQNSDREIQSPAGFAQGETTDSSGKYPVPPPLAKQVSNPDWDKRIIKTATLRLEVADFKNYNENVHKIIKQYGGYVAQEEQHLADEMSETTISIKVPVDQFEDMMNQLPVQSTKVLERKITTEDVTGEVVDTKSRLEAKKEMRLKYLDFLKQSKNMAEVLQVQNEISSIQEEIESAAGRINFLSHQASFSTINLSFYQPVPGFKAPVDEKPSFFKRLKFALGSGIDWFAELFIGLATIWPLILVIIIAIIAWKKSRTGRAIQQNA